MTTPDPIGGAPTPPSPPIATAYPGATGTLPPQPFAPKKPSGFALAALLVGIAAFLFGLIPVFGALVGVAAGVLGFLALQKQQSKGMAIAGMVLGGLALIASIGTTVGIGAAVNSSSLDRPPAAVAESSEPEAEEPVEAAPVEEPVVEEPAAPAVPVEYLSALTKAESYSEIMHMSKAAIFDQLTSEYGEKFSAEASQYAIDTIQADWNANALEKAKSYQESMAMSPAAIHDQLTSEYGEQFTAAEADYAIANLPV